MRRARMLTALLLACILLFSCCPVRGEKLYCVLRELLSQNPEASWYLGEGKQGPMEDSREVMMLYSEAHQLFALRGMNETGAGEATLWNGIDQATAVSVVYKLCLVWNRLDSILEKDNGYSLSAVLMLGDDSGAIAVIKDAETAAEFVKKMDAKYIEYRKNEAEQEAEQTSP